MLVVVGIAGYFVWKSSITTPISETENIDRSVENTPKTSTTTQNPATIAPTPKGTPVPLKPDNGVKGTYQLSMGTHTGPTITQVVFDPLDVKKGQNLNLTVKANFTGAISSMTATLTTDNSSQNVNFSLSSGNPSNGEWTGQLTLNDSVDYKYILTITARSANDSSTVTVAPRSE